MMNQGSGYLMMRGQPVLGRSFTKRRETRDELEEQKGESRGKILKNKSNHTSTRQSNTQDHKIHEQQRERYMGRVHLQEEALNP